MAMKERTGRSRVSKADRAAEKISKERAVEAAPVSRGRSKISKADAVARKIETTPVVSEHTPAARVRPASKADDIGKKIPAPRPASERPVPPVPQQASSRVTPVRPVPPIPQQPSSRVTPVRPATTPSSNRRPVGCLGCLTLALPIVGIICALITIF